MTEGNSTNGYRDPDTFDVKTTLVGISEAARHHKGVVLGTCVMMLGLATLYVYAWPPIYVAHSKLMAEGADYSRDAFYGGWDVFRKDDPKTEIELMTSEPVLKEVIETDHLTFDDVYHPCLSQLTYFWQKSLPGRMYHAVKVRLFPEAPSGLTPQEIELVKTMVDLRASASVEPLGETNIGNLTLKGPSRRVAQIANTLVDVYLKQRTARHFEEAQRSHDALKNELALAGKELESIETRRKEFAEKNGLSFDFQKENLELTKLTELETNIANAQAKIAELQASLHEVEEQLATEPLMQTTSVITQLNSVREAEKTKRLDLQTALIQARDHYREDSPEVQEIERDLAKLDAMLVAEPARVEAATTQGVNLLHQDSISKRDALRTELAGTRSGLEAMRATAAVLRARIAAVPALQTTLRDLDRELASSADRYHAIEEKEAQATASLVTTKTAMPSLRVVEYASPPAEVWWPKTKMLYAISLLIGLILGLFAAMIRSSFDGLVRREHVAQGRRAMPLYGTIAVGGRGWPLTLAPRAGTAALSPSDRD